jgi:hypothetical protein
MNKSHKEAAVEFLKLVASGQVREAYQKHVGAEFRHHNPFFRGDAASLMEGMQQNAAKSPNKVLEKFRVRYGKAIVSRSSRACVSSRQIEVERLSTSSASKRIASLNSGMLARLSQSSR